MNWINTTWSQQAATVTPSSPAVVQPNVSAQAAPREPQDVKTEMLQSDAQAQEVADNRDGVQAMKLAAEQIESYLRSIGRALEFRIDDTTGRTVVTVTDSATGETIRQIPSEEALRLARSLGNQSSALIDLVV